MRISVIVCTYRRVDDVRRLLECLRGQTFGDFEVLVVEGIEAGTSVPRASADFGLSGDGHFNLKVLAAPLGGQPGVDPARWGLLQRRNERVYVPLLGRERVATLAHPLRVQREVACPLAEDGE